MKFGLAAALTGALLICSLAPAAAQSPDLKDREIDLLKRRLEKARTELNDERIGRIIYQTQLEAAHLHGLPAGQLLAYDELTPRVLDRVFDDSIAKQYPGRAFELYNWVLRFFGAIPEDLEMRRFLKDLMSEQAGGLYDPFTKKLYVNRRFDVTGAMGRLVLAHEIMHALQDQNFDMESMGVMEPETGDAAAAVLAVLEGDATLLMGEVVMQGSNSLSSLLSDLPKMAMMDQSKLYAAPEAIRQSLIFPYIQGAAFFQTLAGRTRQRPGGVGSAWMTDGAWRNAILADPPASTEQILHPEKYLTNERPMPIPPLPLPSPGGALPHALHDVAGEFGIQLLLGELVGPVAARAAAEGWGGDRMLIAEDDAGARHVLRWVAKWETPRDADEFAAALREGLKKRFGDKGLVWVREGEDATASFGNNRISVGRPDGVSVTLAADVRLIPNTVRE
jgi:hypothetical protein